MTIKLRLHHGSIDKNGNVLYSLLAFCQHRLELMNMQIFAHVLLKMSVCVRCAQNHRVERDLGSENFKLMIFLVKSLFYSSLPYRSRFDQVFIPSLEREVNVFVRSFKKIMEQI